MQLMFKKQLMYQIMHFHKSIILSFIISMRTSKGHYAPDIHQANNQYKYKKNLFSLPLALSYLRNSINTPANTPSLLTR